MSVLYRTLRRVFDVAVELYFVEIRVTGASKIPESGPVVFAANHPNSIMDTVLLGTQIDRQIHYLAKSELFSNPVITRVFDAAGVIPLHQKPDGESSNESAFRNAFELLGSGRCLGIFPEGRNSPERGIHELKTGVARIALGAESESDYDLGVRVVPVGLNFEQRDRFMSRVVLRVGDPIEASEFAARHRKDERGAVRALTDRVAESLGELVTTMADDRARQLAEQVDHIYGGELLDDAVTDGLLGSEGDAADASAEGFGDRLLREIKQIDRSGGGEEFDRRLRRQGRIAEAVNYYDACAPEIVRELEIRVQRYLDHLEQAQIRSDLGEETGSTSRRREALKLTAYAVVFALPAAWGLVHNVIPYNLMRLSALRAPDEPMRAFTGLLAGLVVFAISYGAVGWAAWQMLGFGLWSTVAYLLSLPVSGFFFLRYRRQVLKYRNRILARTFALTRHGLVDALVDERRELVEAFERLREHYRAVEGAREADETPPPPPDLGLSPWWEMLRER